MQKSLFFCPIKVRSSKKRPWPSPLTDFRASRLRLTWPDELQEEWSGGPRGRGNWPWKSMPDVWSPPYELILDHLVRREVNHCKRPRLSAFPPGESPEVVEKNNMRRRPPWRFALSAGYWVVWQSSISEAQGCGLRDRRRRRRNIQAPERGPGVTWTEAF